MNRSEDESAAATIARLEQAVASLRAALDNRMTQRSSTREADLEAENARLRQELESVQASYHRLKARSDSAGVKINRTIEELESMLGGQN